MSRRNALGSNLECGSAAGENKDGRAEIFLRDASNRRRRVRSARDRALSARSGEPSPVERRGRGPALAETLPAPPRPRGEPRARRDARGGDAARLAGRARLSRQPPPERLGAPEGARAGSGWRRVDREREEAGIP